MSQEIAQAVAGNRAYLKHCRDRLRLGHTKLVIDSSGEVSYKTKAKDALGSKPFKPLQDMTMKMLADAVNHAKLKQKIAEEVKSELSDQNKRRWQESSSEDLYSNGGASVYELPPIDPDKL